MCDSSGRQLAAFLRSLDKAMRPLFQAHTDARGHLTQGEVFVFFVGCRTARANSAVMLRRWRRESRRLASLGMWCARS